MSRPPTIPIIDVVDFTADRCMRLDGTEALERFGSVMLGLDMMQKLVLPHAGHGVAMLDMGPWFIFLPRRFHDEAMAAAREVLGELCGTVPSRVAFERSVAAIHHSLVLRLLRGGHARD